MSIISGSINIAQKQLIISCNIAPSGTVLVARDTIDKQKPITAKQTFALVDTGATHTCISSWLARDMKLQHDGLSSMVTAGGLIDSKLYLVDLILNFVDHHVANESLRVSEIELPQESVYHVILGMDLILRGHLSISRDGHFLFAL